MGRSLAALLEQTGVCVSELWLPCSRIGMGQELVGMLIQAGQGSVSHQQPRNLGFPM